MLYLLVGNLVGLAEDAFLLHCTAGDAVELFTLGDEADVHTLYMHIHVVV